MRSVATASMAAQVAVLSIRHHLQQDRIPGSTRFQTLVVPLTGGHDIMRLCIFRSRGCALTGSPEWSKDQLQVDDDPPREQADGDPRELHTASLTRHARRRASS